MKKIILFDYDGVIVDSLELTAKIHQEIAGRFGKNVAINADLIRTNWNGWQDLYCKVYGFTQEELPHTVSMYRDLLKREEKLPKVFPGMSAVLKTLAQDHALYVVSANYYEIISNSLEKSGLSEYFKKIFAREQLGAIEKSDPRFFLQPLEDLDVEKEDVVVVGDTVGEIVGAGKAGIAIIACSWGWQEREALIAARPDYIADTPKELLSIIQGLT